MGKPPTMDRNISTFAPGSTGEVGWSISALADCRVFKSQAWGPITPILRNCATRQVRYLRPSSLLNTWITP